MDKRQLYRKERKRKEKIWAFIAFVISIVVVSGIVVGSYLAVTTYLFPIHKDNQKSDEVTEEVTDTIEDVEETQAETGTETDDSTSSDNTISTEEISAMVQDALGEMTLEEKVGQLFMVPLTKLNDDAAVETVTDKVLANMENYHVGGVVFLQENISDEQQLMDSIQKLQGNSKIPLFIAATEESGETSILSGDAGVGLTSFPNQSEIGATGDSNEAYTYGSTMGKEMKALGFTVNLAPVTDVVVSNSTGLGQRTFGNDASVVADMVSKVVSGMQENGVYAVLKYFPGYGSAVGNTSDGAATINRTMEQLQSTELVPYQAGIEAGANFIMVGHAAVPQIAKNTIPSSLNSAIITDLLRNTMGYTGIVMTDELNKKAIADRFNAADAAVRAVEAGADILLMPASLKSAYTAILENVKAGTISEDRINESVTRILEQKFKAQLQQ